MHGLTATGKPLRDHFEIVGHNEALLWINDIVKGNKPLTEQFIRELHQMILKERYQKRIKTPDGNYATTWVEVGQYKNKPNHVETSTGELFYFALPEETPAKMGELVDWFNTEAKNNELHPLLLAAELHYRFVRIHPFDDGNGRVARLLTNFALMRFGYCPLIVDTNTKVGYLTALEAYDAGQDEAYYGFMAQALADSMNLMLQGARGESLEQEEDWKKKLKLIQKSIQEKTPSLATKTPDLLNQRIKDSFQIVYKELLIALAPFDEIYSSTNHQPDRIISGKGPVANGVKSDTIVSQKQADELQRIEFTLNWEALKHSTNERYDIGVAVGFDLSDPYFYTLNSSTTRNPFIKKKYTNPITTEERKSFINVIGKRLAGTLEEQNQEIQSNKSQ
ncbi:MAG: Fic family protein [Bacteroidota bacterium]